MSRAARVSAAVVAAFLCGAVAAGNSGSLVAAALSGVLGAAGSLLLTWPLRRE